MQERSRFSIGWMQVMSRLCIVLVSVAMLAGMLSEGYRSEHNIAKFPHWARELYLYTAANFHGGHLLPQGFFFGDTSVFWCLRDVKVF